MLYLDSGKLYGWGDNSKGQLGLGSGAASSYAVPQRIRTLDGVNIVSSSCGDDFSIALSGDY